jgi:hypothetical protein
MHQCSGDRVVRLRETPALTATISPHGIIQAGGVDRPTLVIAVDRVTQGTEIWATKNTKNTKANCTAEPLDAAPVITAVVCA